MMQEKGVMLTLLYIAVSIFFLTGCSKNSTKDPFAKYPAKELPRQVTNPAQRDVPLKEPPAMTAEEYERSGDSNFNSGNLQQAFLQYDKSLRLAPGKPQLSYKIGLLFLLNKMTRSSNTMIPIISKPRLFFFIFMVRASFAVFLLC